MLAHGRAVFAATPDESHYNPESGSHPHGFVGLAGDPMLDSAMGCAVQSTLPVGLGLHDAGAEGRGFVTRDHAGITGPVRCRAAWCHDGRDESPHEPTGPWSPLETGKLSSRTAAPTCLDRGDERPLRRRLSARAAPVPLADGHHDTLVAETCAEARAPRACSHAPGSAGRALEAIAERSRSAQTRSSRPTRATWRPAARPG